MIATRPILTKDEITLMPLEDISYLVELAGSQINGYIPADKTLELVKLHNGEHWSVYYKDTRCGVVGYFTDGITYFFDGLKDQRIQGIGITTSIKAAQMMIDHMFNFTKTVVSCAFEQDKAIQILLKKIGFQYMMKVKNAFVYKKENLPCPMLSQ